MIHFILVLTMGSFMINIETETNTIKFFIEAALLAAGGPLSLAQLRGLFDERDSPSDKELVLAITALQVDYEERAFRLIEVASGYCLQVAPQYSYFVAKMWEEKPSRYSRAFLETLALIAYRQPITRAEIEDIRGVAVSSSLFKTLFEREWIRVVGHKDVLGRPSLYATTRQFLDDFNLKNLEDLPPLTELTANNNATEALEELPI